MIKFILTYIKLYKVKFFMYLFTALILLVLGLFSPYIESKFIDGLIYNPNYNFLIKMIIIIGIISLLNIIISYLQNLLLITLNLNISFATSNDIINRLKKVSILILSKYDSAYLCERISTDTNTLIEFFLSNIIKFFTNAIIIIFCLTLIYIKFGIYLVIVISLILPIYILIYRFLKNPLYLKKMNLVENQSHFFSVLNRIFKTLKNIKIKVLFDESEELYKNSFQILFKSILSFNKISYIFSSLNNMCNSLLHIIIIIFTGIKIINGELTIGEFTLINSYCNMIVSSITYYLSLGESYQTTKVSYSRIKEFFNLYTEKNNNYKLNNLETLTIKNLTFTYNEDKVLIDNFSYKFQKGYIYSLIGSNGVGKSTLIDLILSIINENYSGSILYNDVNINSLDMYYIRKYLISVVEQEPYLHVDTIYNNLVYNVSNINHDLLNKLLVKFNLQNTINSFPNKFNTIINDNIKNLSGGERQKIAIINSLISNSDLLILDEPTSALDISSVQVLKEILVNLKSDKIIILISHDENFYNICDYTVKL